MTTKTTTNKKELFNKLLALCKSNKQGFTANKKAELLNLNKGYAVSITNNKAKDINKLVNSALSLAKQHKTLNFCFGGWYDQEANEFYLDLSLIISNLNEAMQKAKQFNQKAIFNFNNYNSIDVLSSNTELDLKNTAINERRLNDLTQ